MSTDILGKQMVELGYIHSHNSRFLDIDGIPTWQNEYNNISFVDAQMAMKWFIIPRTDIDLISSHCP